MAENSTNAEYLIVRKTAEEYRSKGYEVTIDAPLDFMPGFTADLLVRKGDEAKVIEVKSRGSLEAGSRFKELAEILYSKPGWSFAWQVVSTPERLDSPEGAQAFDREYVFRRIWEVEQLMESGHSEAALALAWSACEAAIRLMVAEEGVVTKGITTAGYVLDQAVFLGVISRDEGSHLDDVKRYRNAVVHGFRHDGFDDAMITDLVETARRIMAGG